MIDEVQLSYAMFRYRLPSIALMIPTETVFSSNLSSTPNMFRHEFEKTIFDYNILNTSFGSKYAMHA